MPHKKGHNGKNAGNGKSSTGNKSGNGNGMKLKKGSQEAKDYMKKLRAKRGKK